MSQHLLESIEGGIATLTMNRPEARNALSAEMFDGLVNRAVPAVQLSEAARAWAAELAALPTIAIGYMKRNLNAGLQGTLAQVLDAEAIHMIRTFETADHKGAAAAFVEKCAPSFNGR